MARLLRCVIAAVSLGLCLGFAPCSVVRTPTALPHHATAISMKQKPAVRAAAAEIASGFAATYYDKAIAARILKVLPFLSKLEFRVAAISALAAVLAWFIKPSGRSKGIDVTDDNFAQLTGMVEGATVKPKNDLTPEQMKSNLDNLMNADPIFDDLD